jgi:hypothetical protein
MSWWRSSAAHPRWNDCGTSAASGSSRTTIAHARFGSQLTDLAQPWNSDTRSAVGGVVPVLARSSTTGDTCVPFAILNGTCTYPDA